MKEIVDRDVLCSYPNFNEEFIIHTDARNIHLGEVIRQNGKPIPFYLRKLTLVHINFKIIEVKLLCIVETLRYHYSRTPYNIIYGPQNIIYENFTTEKVLS